jgi:hypothetical protein
MPSVILSRFLLVLLYATYLAYAGLFFLVGPWTDIWTIIVIRLPVPVAAFLGHPAVRGMISAFGVLHFIVALLEMTTGLRSKTTS